MWQTVIFKCLKATGDHKMISFYFQCHKLHLIDKADFVAYFKKNMHKVAFLVFADKVMVEENSSLLLWNHRIAFFIRILLNAIPILETNK